jgi:hypothetical protein
MEVSEDNTRLQRLNTARLHLSDNLINSRRLRAKRPVNGEGARNIRSIAFPLTTRIEAYEFPAREVFVISIVVESTCVLPRPDDRRVSLLLSMLRDAGLEECSLELRLVGCGVQAGEDVAVRGGGDSVCAAEEGDLVGGFDDACFVHGGLEGGGVEAGGYRCQARRCVGRMQKEDLLVRVAGCPFEDMFPQLARVAHLVHLILIQTLLDTWRWPQPDDFRGLRGGDVEG